jgi:hypothetical protein
MKQFAVVVAAVTILLPGMACAQLQLWGGVEYFKWDEDTTPSVTETGPVLAVGFDYFVPRDSGFVPGYRGKLWFGSIDYEGADLFTGAPVNSTTDYTGFSNELQGRFRGAPRAGGYFTDFVLGVGYDTWERKLSSAQKESFSVGYARLGFEVQSKATKSWSGSAGIKYPFYTREDAHLTDIGFDANPKLEPGKSLSLYADLGYRFTPNWRLTGYYDGYRFTESNAVTVNEIAMGLGPVTLVQPASTMSVFGLKIEYLFP